MRSAEEIRLIEDCHRRKNWKRWGTYLSERQWGTVREDYSWNGDVWTSVTHDEARSKAYRWGEDGLLGLCDRQCRLCFALALWNGRDPILKERLFGLSETEGNHGEDVKECYYYLRAAPTHSYCKALYKYPQNPFPYQRLRDENRERGLNDPEFELEDTGIFDDHRYFDVFVEYAKGEPNDILIRISAVNRGPDTAQLYLLPTLWFHNTWSWGCRHEGCTLKPDITSRETGILQTEHDTLERFLFAFPEHEPRDSKPELLFTDNETNFERLYGAPNEARWVKDAFHDYLISGKKDAVSPRGRGTKACLCYRTQLEPGGEIKLPLRLCAAEHRPGAWFGPEFDGVFDRRMAEYGEFYQRIVPGGTTSDEREVIEQAYAGLLWSKQFYHYIVEDWLDGDPNYPPPPAQRKHGRNSNWRTLYSRDVLSMPDKWEYPWFAAWDLAFHMIPLAKVDPHYVKQQLQLLLREWYMHPSGEIPAYEFNFSEVNPPVQAWAAWRVYKIIAPRGARDSAFLQSVFQKLLLDFTWWVNRKDRLGNNLFSGGFLGMDNIGPFDRSRELPDGGYLEQADGTAWMAFYCLTMFSIACELAAEDRVYEDMASKFFEHFVSISDAINCIGGHGLWDEHDGFYYDQLQVDGERIALRCRSLVGLVPLIAVEVLEEADIRRLSGFAKRMDWFLRYRQDLRKQVAFCELSQGKRLFAMCSRDRLQRLLRYIFDENEFLSPFGIRSLSRIYQEHPCIYHIGGRKFELAYAPGESNSYAFGGNSNWRGPIWFPLNFLIIEALERFHHFYGDDFKIELPTGSGTYKNLKQAADDLSGRLVSLFARDHTGRRPCFGTDERYISDPHWKDLVLFYEYFHAETGRGLGASHQTGWTALIANFLENSGKRPRPLGQAASG